jgi:hypothetical protein
MARPVAGQEGDPVALKAAKGDRRARVPKGCFNLQHFNIL